MPPSRLDGDGNLVICLPIPDKDISPNARRGQSKWAAMKKARKIRAHRTAAYAATLDAVVLHLGGFCPNVAGYSLVHYFRTKAFRDDDNADGACKAYRDGIADALNINDRDLRKTKLSLQGKDAMCPRVEITLWNAPVLSPGGAEVSKANVEGAKR